MFNKQPSFSKYENRYGNGGGGRDGGGRGPRSGGGRGGRPSYEGGGGGGQRRGGFGGGGNQNFSEEVRIVNLEALENSYNSGDTVTIESLVEKGIIKANDFPVKILGGGNLTKNLIVQVNRYSAFAQEAIEKAGGRAERV